MRPAYRLMTPLSYLMNQLKLNAADWKTFSEDDRNTLKKWADEEMDVLGL